MKLVNAHDSRHVAELFAQPVDVEPGGRDFEQDLEGLEHQAHGRKQDQESDEEARDRISLEKARCENDRPSRDNGKGAQRVRK